MTAPIYAIGDIHGHLDMLETALARIERDGGPDARVVFLGDLVDRGPDSRGVVELLSNGVAAGRNWVVLKGNHDRMYSMFLGEHPRSDPRLIVGWDWFHENLGGRQTLASYEVTVEDRSRTYEIHQAARAAVPQAHIDFMANLPSHHLEDGKLFVHAGIRPGVALAEQTDDDLLWIRGEFLMDQTTHPFLVVHGHTPQESAKHMGNRVNLDSGAAWGRPLTAAAFEGDQVWTLTDTARKPLTPDA